MHQYLFIFPRFIIRVFHFQNQLFLLFYAVTGLAVALGVLVAMRQRLRELDQGEEEDAKKY